MKYTILLACSLLLASCASIHEIGPQYAPNKDPAKGIVIASLSHTPEIEDFPPQCSYRGIGIPVKGETPEMTSWRAGLDKSIFNTNTGAMVGRVTVMELPAGDYEFFSCRMRLTGGTLQVRSPTAFSLPFKVVPGKTVYLGNIEIDRADGKFGIRTGDSRERDFEVVRTKWPQLDLTGVTTELLRFNRGR